MKIVKIGFRGLLRLLARHCILPSLRISLYRLSGIKIGKNVFVNMDVWFMDDYQSNLIEIEDGVSIAPYVSIIAVSSPNYPFIKKIYDISKKEKVLIKEGAWIGAGAVILPGVTIGKGSIIGANAVVTKDVDDFAIMTGIPAKKVGDIRDKPASKTNEN